MVPPRKWGHYYVGDKTKERCNVSNGGCGAKGDGGTEPKGTVLTVKGGSAADALCSLGL